MRKVAGHTAVLRRVRSKICTIRLRSVWGYSRQAVGRWAVGRQEGARGHVEHVVAVGIEVEVLGNELTGPQSQSLGQPLNVFLVENGASGFAAIGAGQAVGLGKNLVVQVVELVVQRLGLEQLLGGRLGLGGFLGQLGNGRQHGAKLRPGRGRVNKNSEIR